MSRIGCSIRRNGMENIPWVLNIHVDGHRRICYTFCLHSHDSCVALSDLHLQSHHECCDNVEAFQRAVSCDFCHFCIRMPSLQKSSGSSCSQALSRNGRPISNYQNSQTFWNIRHETPNGPFSEWLRSKKEVGSQLLAVIPRKTDSHSVAAMLSPSEVLGRPSFPCIR